MKIMRQISLSIKFFAGSQVSPTKKWMNLKTRFGEQSTEAMQEIVDNAVPETTKKATKFELRLFHGTYQLSFSEKLQNFKL